MRQFLSFLVIGLILAPCLFAADGPAASWNFDRQLKAVDDGAPLKGTGEFAEEVPAAFLYMTRSRRKGVPTAQA